MVPGSYFAKPDERAFEESTVSHGRLAELAQPRASFLLSSLLAWMNSTLSLSAMLAL